MRLVLVLLSLMVPPGSHAPGPGEAPADTLVLTHASLVSPARNAVLRDRTVVIVDGVIRAIRPTRETPPGPGGEIHDLDGAYVLPGLIDAHVHLREPRRGLVLFPASGVTTVVNLEGEPSHLALRDSVLGDGDLAPRIVTSGPFLDERASSAEEAIREVRRQHAAGYDLIKIHGEMDGGAFGAGVTEAGRLGLAVVAHRPDNEAMDTVLGSGLSALAHVEELLGSSLLEEPTDLSPDSLERVARRIAESGTAVITTLGFFTGMRDQATDRFYTLVTRPELAYVSPERRHAWLHDGHREYIEDSEIPWYDEAVEILHRVTGAIHEEGGVIVAGTDTPLEFTIPGFSLHRELRHLVSAGLTPLEALGAATVVPADLLGRPDLGRLDVGAAADLLVLDADPTRSLSALDRRTAVVVRGSWHSEEEIATRLDALAASYARDEVRRAARERVRESLVAVIRAGGAEAGLREAGRLAELSGAPRLTEGDLNGVGYRFLGDGDVETAIEVFRLNVRLYPTSANVHDSLGEAYLSADRLDEAEASYRRALELDPTMDSARRGLREIEERRDPGPPPGPSESRRGETCRT